MKPTLYQYAACPFCNKVRTMLQYKGVQFETVEVHPLKKTELRFSPGYRAVPIYIDSSGKQVNDSTPILRHIDKEFPNRRVFTDDAEARVEEARWLNWSEKFVKGLPTAIYDTLPNALKSFDYVTRVGKFSLWEKWSIKFSGAFVMTLVARKIKKREGIEDPARFLREEAAEWAAGLGRRPFMGGENPGPADIAVFGFLRAIHGLSAEKILLENAAFTDWRNRMGPRLG